MSSSIQAKAEAQKQQLIKRYNKLQAEARTADAAEASRKAEEAEKLVSQISALQSAITKLQTKKDVGEKPAPAEKETPDEATDKASEAEKAALEMRIARIETAQQKTREQIEQLSRAKQELARLKSEAEQNAVKERRANDEKLQQELAKLIEKKEAEQARLKSEIEAIRKQSERDAELLRVQRDSARAIMEKQKLLEKEKLLIAHRSKNGMSGLLIGAGISATIIVGLLGVIFMTPLLDNYVGGFKSKIIGTSTVATPPERKVDNTAAVAAVKASSAAAEESAASEAAVSRNLSALEVYRDSLKSGGQAPVMVRLPGGTFMMGARGNSPYASERPQHSVTLNSFSISKYEITFAEYDRFATATGRRLPEDSFWGRGNRPVINITWEDAVAYTKWLTEQTSKSYRLPSEREWEYAAGAGAETIFWWGFKLEPNKANCLSCNGEWAGKETAPVGSFDANIFGLHDIAGNVMEWTNSCKRSYQGAPPIGNLWEGGDCTRYMVRSSSFMHNERELRTTRREDYSPQTRSNTIGFRIVRVD